jgi:hypothetical protein
VAARFLNAYRSNHGRTGFEGDWDDFVEALIVQLRQAKDIQAGKDAAPYYEPANVLKRSVYELVLDLEETDMAGKIDDLIDGIRVARENGKRLSDRRVLRRLQKECETDTFYYILLGLEGVGFDTFSLTRSNVTRFARQLNYARRHRVPPEFLVGFLMQTGSIGLICKRAREPKRVEKWFADLRKADRAKRKSLLSAKADPPLVLSENVGVGSTVDLEPTDKLAAGHGGAIERSG